MVDSMRQDFELARKRSDAGTAIVIPFPTPSLTSKGVSQVIAREFPLPILRGELKVVVDGLAIDSTTLVGISEEPEVNEFNRFLSTTLFMKPNAVVKMKQEEIDRIGPRKLGDFTPLVETWKAGEPVCVEVEVELGAKKVGHFRVSCKKVLNELKGRAQVCRGGLVISDYSDRYFAKRFNAIAYIAADDNLGMLLRSAEDPSHRKWVAADILTECPNAERVIRCISKACDDLVNTIESRIDEVDLGIFSDVLPAGEGPEATEPPPEGKSTPFVISMPTNGSAVIQASSKYDGPKDAKWRIDLVYDSVNGAGRARKSFRPGSFSLLNAIINTSGGDIVSKSDNSFTAIMRDAEKFRVEIVGIRFAGWADIRVHAEREA